MKERQDGKKEAVVTSAQNLAVLCYLREHGSITTAEAFSELGITRLSARMKEIIASGVPIEKAPETAVNRQGATVRYTRYRLAKSR